MEWLLSEVDRFLPEMDGLLSEEDGLLSVSDLGPSLLLRTLVMISVAVGSCFRVVLAIVNYTGNYLSLCSKFMLRW